MRGVDDTGGRGGGGDSLQEVVDLGLKERSLLECGLLSTVPYSIVSYWVLVQCSAAQLWC